LAPISARGQSPSSDGVDLVLNPGDLLRITVWRRAELSGEFEVATDGSIVHPLYRGLKVAGIPLLVAEERVRTFLNQHEGNPPFVMAPLFRVTVGGQVQKPNVYSFPSATTVSQALALAGGVTERGRLNQVQIFRQGKVLIIDLTRPDARGAQMPTRSGDQITVPHRGSSFRDIIGPLSSVVAALAAIATLVVYANR
jgi:protein involved in polysaccharide export with SLBB domain